MEIKLLVIGIIIFLCIILFATFKAFIQLFKESENDIQLNKKVTIRCPKCSDTYTIDVDQMAGNGLSPVQCYKCGYSYKQKFAIVEE